MLLTRDRLQALADRGLDHVQISIQAASAANAHRMRAPFVRITPVGQRSVPMVRHDDRVFTPERALPFFRRKANSVTVPRW